MKRPKIEDFTVVLTGYSLEGEEQDTEYKDYLAFNEALEKYCDYLEGRKYELHITIGKLENEKTRKHLTLIKQINNQQETISYG